MDNSTPNRKIEEQAEVLIRLGNLLRQARSSEKQQSVEKIMRSHLSIQEKIKRIRKIDDYREESPLKDGTPPGRQQTIRPKRYRQLAQKAQVEIKVHYTPRSYLSFLFKECRKVRQFGKKTHILVPVLFPPSVKLNKDLGPFFAKYLQPLVSELLEILKPALEIGWLYLHKIDYNLIAVLKRLCLKIQSINFRLLNFKDKKLINRLRSLEKIFLTLQYRSEYPEKIISALYTFLQKNSDFQADPLNISILVRKILYQDLMFPSLYNFLLGLNMLKNNRYFDLHELMLRNSDEIIDTAAFDCEPKICQRIQSFIEESTRNLLLLHEKKQEILKRKIFLPTAENGEADFSLLQSFYNTFQSVTKYNYGKDKENIILFTPRFLRLFIQTFEPLLNGEVKFSRGGKVKLFSSMFFQMEFPKLYYLIGKLEKLAFNCPIFPRKRYLLLKNTGKGAISVEAEVMQLIDENLTQILGIGRKLATVLSLRIPAGKSGDDFEPLDPIILQGKPFGLPYEEKTINSKNFLHGRTVVEALKIAISIGFLTGIFFLDQDTLTLLIREQELNQKIRSKLEMLERIADSEIYMELRSICSG